MSNKFQPIKADLSPAALRWRMIGTFVLLLVCLVIIMPGYFNRGVEWVNAKANIGLPKLPASGFSLGLDLQGGAHLVYEADTANIPDKDRADAVEGVRDVIERRVRGGLGVAEPLVQTNRVGESYRIIVELPGVQDVNQAIKMIGETPVLEFKEENNEPQRALTADEQKQLDAYNLAAEKKAKEALAKAKAGTNFVELVEKYSEDTESKKVGGNLGFINSAAYPEIYAWAKTAPVGGISQTLVESFGGVNILKKTAERSGDKQVTAAHILICYKGATGCDNTEYTKDQARAKIEEIKKQANAQNFADLAKEYSMDPSNKDTGGDLGSFTAGQMVPEFEKEAFAMPVGTVSSPVETQFGYHLIYKKSEEVVKEYEVSRIFITTKTAADIVPPAEQWKSTGLSGKQLERASVNDNAQTGQIEVSLQFNSEGSQLFADITKRNTGKPVAIFLDGEPISIPRVNEPILNGSAVISGDFSLTEAKLLSQRLNSGALPVPVNLISQQTVGATLGADSLRKSFKAGIIGLIIVMIFMIVYYRAPGILSVYALALYAALSLAIFKVIGVTLTLSGIAGFILSVGMAVDANVLVFERLKEELRLRKTLRTGMEESFVRAWSSIRDSNITTLISCVFLIWMGAGFVQGFAVTLAIGVLASMFTAIIITRTVMRYVLQWFSSGGSRLFLGYEKPSVDLNQNANNLK